jgi:hypothetical protein
LYQCIWYNNLHIKPRQTEEARSRHLKISRWISGGASAKEDLSSSEFKSLGSILAIVSDDMVLSAIVVFSFHRMSMVRELGLKLCVWYSREVDFQERSDR